MLRSRLHVASRRWRLDRCTVLHGVADESGHLIPGGSMSTVVKSNSVVKSLRGIVAFAITTIVVALPGLVPALRLVLDKSLNQKDRELA